jgi:hypothetical protein
LTSTCPAYVADDTPRAASPRAAQPSSYYTLKYYTLSSWRIAAFHSTLLARESHTLDTHTRASGTRSKCRLSSTTRCRRRCEVSTWTEPISTFFGGNTWRKRQQRVGYVAVERFKSIRRGIPILVCCPRSETPKHPAVCRGGTVTRQRAWTLRATGTRYSVSQIADFHSQANVRNAVASSPRSSTPSNPSAPTKSSHLRFSQTPKAWPFSLFSKLVS